MSPACPVSIGMKGKITAIMTSIGLNRKSHRATLLHASTARLICNYLGQFIYDDERIERQITIQFLCD